MNSRNPSLDVLRGVAILSVIGYHLQLPGFSLGWVGVDLFFVLSGFLISRLLFREYQKQGQISLKRFWIRRALKILPPVYFFLAIVALGQSLLHFRHISTRGLGASALFWFNYVGSETPGFSAAGDVNILRHTWSLSVEEQFYLAFPLLVFALAFYRRLRWLPMVLGAVIAACFIFRLHNPGMFQTHLRADALAVGVALGYAETFHSDWLRNRFSSWLFLALGCVFWLPGYLETSAHPGLHSLCFTLTELLAGCLLVWCFTFERNGLWHFPLLRIVGSIGIYSYSIYLWQQPLVVFNQSGLPVKLAGFVFAILFGIAMAKLIEVPSMRLRDWIFRTKLQPRSLRLPVAPPNSVRDDRREPQLSCSRSYLPMCRSKRYC